MTQNLNTIIWTKAVQSLWSNGDFSKDSLDVAPG